MKRIVVTGGKGFLGSHVVKRFEGAGYTVLVPRQEDYDLRLREHVHSMYEDMEPEIVIHLAAAVGGIGANMQNPGKFFYDNLVMGAEIIDLAREYEIEKFVQVGTVCAYPNTPPVPFKEEDIWNGYPEPTNAPYGIAKRVLLEMLQAYRKQYGLNGIYLIPTNLYGERDNFNPESSHVMPALIRKCLEAKRRGDPSIEVWGTGKASREFLYAGDAAEAIFLATEKYNSPEPVNLGSGEEITMRDLVAHIKLATGYKGFTIWNHDKPDGQMRRFLDVSRAKEFGFEAKMHLWEGIQRTVRWYEETQCASS